MLAGVTDRSEPPDRRAPARPVGVVLAGGMGRRLGGAKAVTELAGRPLIAYAFRALAEVLDDVQVVAKDDTELPQSLNALLWIEPPEPRHPVAGIVHALRMAAGRAVVVCAVDMPFLTREVVSRLAFAKAGGAAAVVASRDGVALEPLLARYEPQALSPLAAAASGAGEPLRTIVARLEPRIVQVEDDVFFNVNTPEDLEAAALALRRSSTRT